MSKHEFFNGAVRKVLPPRVPFKDTFATHDEDKLRKEMLRAVGRTDRMKPLLPAGLHAAPKGYGRKPHHKVLWAISRGNGNSKKLTSVCNLKSVELRPILNALVDQGYVQFVVVKLRNQPSKVYSLTEAGRETLADLEAAR